MGAIGSMLGMAGGAGGSGFSGPEEARIDRPTTIAQANTAYDQSNQALVNQDFFTQQVLAQGGLNNQTSVFNQLQNVANGQGPNPAQAMLNQATGANVANQAALIAGQRGSNANVGLMARQAAQQGAQTQQQAIGQGANMQAQQSLNAMGAMGNMANQQANQAVGAVQGQTSAAQNQQSNILNSISAQNNAGVGMQSNINNANASMANTRMGQQAGMLSNIMGGPAMAMNMAQGGQVPQKFAVGGEAESAKLVSGGSSGPPKAAPDEGGGGPMGTIMKILPLAMAALNKGGEVPRQMYAQGAQVQAPPMFMAPQMLDLNTQPPIPVNKENGPRSQMGKYFNSNKTQPQTDYKQYQGSGFTADQMSNDASRAAMFNEGALPQPDASVDAISLPGATEMLPAAVDSGADLAAAAATEAIPEVAAEAASSAGAEGLAALFAAKGGEVPAMVSPSEVYLDRKAVKEVARGKDPITAGERIPGKAKVSGNSYANDTVPKMLESGGIVIPKSVMESKHPHWAAHAFVSQILAKNGKLPPKPKSKK